MKLSQSSIVLLGNNFTLKPYVKQNLVRSDSLPAELSAAKHTLFAGMPTSIQFHSGYAIEIKENQMIFNADYDEKTKDKEFKSPPDKLANIVQSYVKKTKGVEFKAVGINFKHYIVPHDFSMLNGLLGEDAVPTQLQFEKYFDKVILSVTIAKIMSKNDENIHGVLYDANFHLDISDEPEEEHTELLTRMLKKRSFYFQKYLELMNDIS